MPDRWSESGASAVNRTNSSSLAEQLQRGFHGLRFEGELEAAYRRDQFQDRLRYLRINDAKRVFVSGEVVDLATGSVRL